MSSQRPWETKDLPEQLLLLIEEARRDVMDIVSSVAPPPADKATSYFPLSQSRVVSEIEKEYQKVRLH